MANSTPSLDLIILDTHSSLTLAVGDVSVYPSTFSISTPTIEITVPSYPMISLPFVASSVQVYNSTTLGITTGTNCDNIALPDGLYSIKYSVYPAYLYYVEKTFLRVDKLMAKWDEAYLKLDLFQCDQAIKFQEQQTLDLIEDYISGAIAASNQCVNKLAVELYTKANSLLDKFINNSCCIK
jgi:hypothetical protein